MREIKFRGKLKEHFGDKNGNVVLQKGTWVYGGIVFDENRVWIDTKYHGEIIVDKDTIGQYTGLKDKNGTEIYEGDVVAEKGHYVNSDRILYQKIQWKESYSCWLRGEYQRLTPKNIKIYDIEVVGNIYDNPELLEKGKE